MVVCPFSHLFVCYDPLCIYVLPFEGDLDRFLSLLECRLRYIGILRYFKASLKKKTCERTSVHSLTTNNWFCLEMKDKRIYGKDFIHLKVQSIHFNLLLVERGIDACCGVKISASLNQTFRRFHCI